MFFRGVDGKPEKSAPLPEVSGLVIDSGFDEFIRSNWHALMISDALSRQFLVPSRLQALGFHACNCRGSSDGWRLSSMSRTVSAVMC